MARPVVLFLHRDPVVHELVAGTLGDDFQFVAAHAPDAAARLAAERRPAVVIVDVESPEASAELARAMRARDPHLRVVFIADARDPGRAWLLADAGLVLPKTYDLERLRLGLHKLVRQYDLASGVERSRDGSDTTERLPESRRRDESSATARIHYRVPEARAANEGQVDAAKGRNPPRS